MASYTTSHCLRGLRCLNLLYHCAEQELAEHAIPCEGDGAARKESTLTASLLNSSHGLVKTSLQHARHQYINNCAGHQHLIPACDRMRAPHNISDDRRVRLNGGPAPATCQLLGIKLCASTRLVSTSACNNVRHLYVVETHVRSATLNDVT